MIRRYTISASVKGQGKSKFIDAYTVECEELFSIDRAREFANELYQDTDYQSASWYDAKIRENKRQGTFWDTVYSERGYWLDAIPQETRKKYLTYALRQKIDNGKTVQFYAIEY